MRFGRFVFLIPVLSLIAPQILNLLLLRVLRMYFYPAEVLTFAISKKKT